MNEIIRESEIRPFRSKKNPGSLRDYIAEEVEAWESPITTDTVLRASHKLYNGRSIFDLRIWGRNKEGKLYPRKGKGLCMGIEGWELGIKILQEKLFNRINKENSPSL